MLTYRDRGRFTDASRPGLIARMLCVVPAADRPVGCGRPGRRTVGRTGWLDVLELGPGVNNRRTIGGRSGTETPVGSAVLISRDPFDRIDGISGLSGIRAGRFEEPGMCSVGSGMVLAIGDLAGATFVTLLAATATQFARAGRLWTLCTIEIELPCGWAGREWPSP
jgi:hypothetical protein